jgi:hypothetical protein
MARAPAAMTARLLTAAVVAAVAVVAVSGSGPRAIKLGASAFDVNSICNFSFGLCARDASPKLTIAVKAEC